MWLRIGLMSAVLIQTLHMINAQDCASKFRNGKKDFVVDLQASVERGAELIASSQVTNAEDCMETCCLLPQCNVVLVDERNSGRSTCSLFNCLYKKGYACRFVGKKGFSSFVLDSVYQQHLDAPEAEGDAGPVAVAGRNVVVRPGEEVTLRGVESRAPEDATITSYRWSIKKGNPSVKMTPTGDQLRVSNLVAGTYDFTLHVTDSNGQSDDATVNIQVLNQEESDMYCLVAKEVGLCRASFPRWHYNAATARCEEFVYGGCKGNNNNFLSEQECGKACANVKGTSTPLKDCTAPCGDEEFQCASGCCIDRSQECDGQAQCTDESDESRCAHLLFRVILFASRFTSVNNPVPFPRPAFCTEPPKVGPCYENQSAWYYNPIQQQCHPFIYSGCQGNDNHFESKDECEKSCHGVTRSALFAPGRFEELEGSDSGSIAIAIVLAVSILALLAVLAFFFLKGHKKGAHQPVATAPPLSGEGGEDDTVVYRSTTKPV
uniref:Serine peptidase inhibitor, Kunitz type 1 b n=1 Tax=Gadus morhua TaxID=8049 RepID=A0A8C5C939_GADMO